MADGATFGAWLRSRRKALDLTQSELAARAGCAAVTIKRLEADDLRPAAALATALAVVLAIPTEHQAAFVQFARGARSSFILVAPTASRAAAEAVLPPHNLPAQRTLLIGRAAELAAVQNLIAAAEGRIVTITGPGGAGKTTLALHCAADLLDQFPDGVFFVDLAPLQHAATIPAALAQVLGQPDVPELSLMAAVAELLQPHTVLIILDNFEHLLDGVAVVTELVAGCPGVKVIVTSRAALHVRGEQEFPLAPLPVPGDGAAPLLDLPNVPAVALFVARAQLVRPDFTLDAANAPAVAAICDRLDGLPLALELAAARVKALTPQSIADLLHNRGYGSPLDLLASRSRELPDRQRSLRSAIAWSYDLLTPDEQRLLRRLAVFPGGATLDAIVAVMAGGAPRPGSARLELLDRVESLVDKSLVTVRATVRGSRYVLLQTIREFALEQLATAAIGAGEERLARQAHAAYLLAMAEDAAQRVRGPAQAAILQQIEVEQDNLRAALEWLLTGAEGATADANRRERLLTALRLTGALRWFWLRREHEREGRTWLERVLAALGWPPAPAPPALASALAQAYSALGDMAWVQSDHAAALRCHSLSAELYRQAGDAAGEAFAINATAAQLLESGQIDQALTQIEQALALARRAGDDWVASLIYCNLGLVYQHQDKLAMAQTMMQTARALSTRVQDDYMSVVTLHNLGDVLRLRKEDEAAISCFEESIALAQQAGFYSLATASLAALGKIDLRHRRLAAARLRFAWGLEFARRQHRPGVTLECLDGLAAAALLDGAAAVAEQIFGAVERLRSMLDYPRTVEDETSYAPLLAALRRERKNHQAWRGGGWSLVEVVDYALKQGEGVHWALGERSVPHAALLATG